MKGENTKSIVISSLFWKFLERGGIQGIQLLLQVVLARLLMPEDYGIISLVSVFIVIANVFVQRGFNTALIQKKEVENIDFSSALYLSLSIAAFLYGIIYLAAPAISRFYNVPLLVSVIRVLALNLFFGAFNSIQVAYVSRNMMFKKLFYSSLGSTLISGTVGIIAAYSGLGVWALVIQQIINQVTISVIMLFTIPWRPKLIFSFASVKVLLSFGWKLLASSLLDTVYMNIRTLFIGKTYSSATLGVYNRGQHLPQSIVENVNGSISSVMFPTLSAYQDDRARMVMIMRRTIMTSSFLIFPMMMGMAVVAEPLVKIVLTEKWLAAVPFIQIFCISSALMPIHTANLQAINAVGRSDIFLKLEIIKKVFGFIILAISIPFGIYAIAIGQVFVSVFSSFINAYPNKVLLDYSYKEQWLDIMPSLAVTIVMGGMVYLLKFLNLLAWQTLVLQILIGMTLYFALAKIFKLESLEYLILTFRELKKERKGISS